MKRDLNAYLLSWKDSQNRKPVLLRGARQVGKSYLANELGRQFNDYLEINFELEPALKVLFDKDLQPRRIVRDIALATGHTITPGKTLLFLDEIQECPRKKKRCQAKIISNLIGETRRMLAAAGTMQHFCPLP
jgi:predicted AAA+ superfamily ATPase